VPQLGEWGEPHSSAGALLASLNCHVHTRLVNRELQLPPAWACLARGYRPGTMSGTMYAWSWSALVGRARHVGALAVISTNAVYSGSELR
jgi:hypothetical protein